MHAETETFDESEAPDGFDLSAERSREDEAAAAGVIERDVEVEPDDDALDEQGEQGAVDDDDAIDDPDATEVPEDL
jgi:hypothetical protein